MKRILLIAGGVISTWGAVWTCLLAAADGKTGLALGSCALFLAALVFFGCITERGKDDGGLD